MKIMWNKKINFIGSLAITFTLLGYGIYLDVLGGCERHIEWCVASLDVTQSIFYTIILYTIFSFITFLLPTHYFTAFFQFARFGLPLTIAALFYINLTYDSGLFGFGAGLDLLLIGLCYSLFILGSLLALGWAWWRNR